LVEVATARAAAAVHFDLPGDVSTIGRRYATRNGESLGVNSLAESSNVRAAAVVRELDVNVKRGRIMRSSGTRFGRQTRRAIGGRRLG
jgi:hypothetical protein